MVTTLIVEDSAPFRQSLKRVLGARFPSMKLEEAGSGEQALKKVRALCPDLIFMDIELPGKNGLEVTKRIKADHPGMTIIILTHYDLPEYREAARQSGADHFLSKDTSTADLLEMVQLILSKRKPVLDEADKDR
jgi:DNA-binding NarL/FixJ family response regulator